MDYEIPKVDSSFAKWDLDQLKSVAIEAIGDGKTLILNDEELRELHYFLQTEPGFGNKFGKLREEIDNECKKEWSLQLWW